MGNSSKCDHIKVFIVEDEPIILQSLRRKVEEADESFEVVGTAFNGEKAFSLICEMKPDLVFTDILMPICNGLTLISRLREVRFEGAVVVVSGYDNFSYAQSAIRLGVTDYLLKPLIMPEFLRLLEELKLRILEKRIVSQREILRVTLRGGEVELPSQLDNGAFLVCLICMGNLSERVTLCAHEALYREKWKELPWESLLPALSDSFEGWWLVDESMANQKFLILSLDPQSPRPVKVFHTLHQQLCERIPEYSMNLCYYSASIPPAQFSQTANRLRNVMQRTVRIDVSGCFDEQFEPASQGEILPTSVLHKLASSTSTEELSKTIHCIAKGWLIDRVPQMQVVKGFELIVDTLNTSGMLPQTSSDLFHMHQQISELLSAEGQCCEKRMEAITDCIGTVMRENTFTAQDIQQFAEEIETFIRTHYAECFSISSIAARYGCSQAYVSKVFKKVKQETPIKFLTRIRMEKAIRLILENPQMDFCLIGEAVGYCDQHYFSRSFKAFTGYTLTDYRSHAGLMGKEE